MGLSGEKGPLGEKEKGKRKTKKREGGGGAMGPMAHVGGATSPLAGHLPLGMWDCPTLLREGG